MSTSYVTESAIEDRTGILRDLAHDLLLIGTLPHARVVLREPRIAQLAHGYFLLNKAYREWRIASGRSNEPVRIAALQAMTIARFLPFLLMDVNEARDLAEARCNEIYALAYAMGILGRSLRMIGVDRNDFWLRVPDVIAAARARTLEPFIADIDAKKPRPGLNTRWRSTRTTSR